MNIIRCMLRKEFLQIFRDPMMLRTMFFIPLVQLFILGYAITFDVKNVPLVVRDADNSALSRHLLEKVKMSGRFRIVGFEPSQERLKSYFEDGRACLSLAIPRDFERNVTNGKPPAMQILVDGVDSNTSLVALGYLQRIIISTWSELLPGQTSGARVESRIRVWFNPNLESRYYMLPGIMAVLLTMTTALLTSMGITREREIGTLEQLSVTPIRPIQLMLGKTLPFAILSFGQLLLALIVILFWYGIPLEGSLGLLLLSALIFLFSTLGVGLFVSTICSTQQQAVMVVFAFIIFAILTSGLFAPIENMPPFVQKLTYLNPLRYFMSIVRELFLKGSGIEYLWRDGLALVFWGFSAILLSTLRFRKSIG